MSQRTPFFGGNWKMNHGPSAAREFVEQFARLYEPRDDRTVVFFPPAVSLAAFKEAATGRADLRTGCDSDEDVSRRVAAISAQRLTPVLCVGEQLEERDSGAVESVVTRQLEAGLSGLLKEAVAEVVVAYEPVWAIGTGRTARTEDANQVHELIRAILLERVGESAARAIPIIYGGSVKPENIEELLAAPEIDGVLVGGASLKPSDFAQICLAG